MAYYLEYIATGELSYARYHTVDEGLFRMVQQYKKTGDRCYLMDADTKLMKALIMEDGTPKWVGNEGYVHCPGSYT